MQQSEEPALVNYPHGRGYGHDYMRGGEVLGGYGYAEREEYEKSRGDRGDEDQPSRSMSNGPAAKTQPS